MTMTKTQPREGREDTPWIGWLVAVGSIAAAILLVASIDWRSDTARLADEFDELASTGAGSAPYDRFIPADIAARAPNFDYRSDASPQIDGEESLMTNYILGDGYAVTSYAYDGHVWGWLVTTETSTMAFTDTNNDGHLDRAYWPHQPVYIPGWVVEMAEGE